MLKDKEVDVKPPYWWFDPILECHIFKRLSSLSPTAPSAAHVCECACIRVCEC